MDDKIWIPLAAAAVAAAMKVAYEIVSGIHQKRLERVTAQVEVLYGPLRALVRASDAAWIDFRKQVRPKQQAFFDPTSPPTEQDIKAWMLWMTEVFVPLHSKMESVILQNVHLIDDSRFPPEFDSLFAHVAGYKPVLAKWKKEVDLSAPDYADYVSTRTYPEGLVAYVEKTFEKLAERQAELLKGPLA